MNDKKLFIEELEALLRKHGAVIAFDCGPGSDFGRLYDEKMIVEFEDDRSITLSEGSCFDYTDVRRLLE